MKNGDMPSFQFVCRVGEVPQGEARVFFVAGKTIGVFNVGGSLFALANECPHAGASLAHGIVEDVTIR